MSGIVGAWSLASVVNGVVLPSVAMTGLVTTLMYFVIMYMPGHYGRERHQLIEQLNGPGSAPAEGGAVQATGNAPTQPQRTKKRA